MRERECISKSIGRAVARIQRRMKQRVHYHLSSIKAESYFLDVRGRPSSELCMYRKYPS